MRDVNEELELAKKIDAVVVAEREINQRECKQSKCVPRHVTQAGDLCR